eukprot:GHVQ01027142.1.p1 GENE.GHVQ01027142.1~~GHVQ01027142.1.p1  ORF type:complete len:154 (-),score=15.35 GHVQ01027142.1:2479-2940(-)
MEGWTHRVLLGVVVVVTAAITTHYANVISPATTNMLFPTQTITAFGEDTATEMGKALLMLRSKIPFFDLLAWIVTPVLLTWSFIMFCMSWRARKPACQVNTGVSYCVNNMTLEEFNDASLTRKSVSELVNSPEYKAMLKEQLARNKASRVSQT